MLTVDPDKTVSSARVARLPAAQRVAGILSERIRSGQYAAGEMLPTERVLADDLHVHRRVVRAAIDQLVNDGIVNRRPHCRPTAAEASRHLDRVDTSRSGSPRISASNLVALIMWHGGGPLEHAGTSQQRIFWGMNQLLTNAGYLAVFLDLGGAHPDTEDETADREAAHLRYVLDQNFGGAVFYPYAYRHNRELAKEVAQSVPLVMIDRKIQGLESDFVGIENHNAMFETTQLLLSKGHRRIVYVTNWEPIDSVQDRVQGYLDAILGANDPDIIDSLLTIPAGAQDRQWIVFDAIFRLPEGDRPTAAICMADYTAVSVAERLMFLGLSVPEDVELTGFDDIVPTLPNGLGLTTVAQPYEQIGSSAVELLIRRIKDPSAPLSTVKLPTKLIIRASTP